MAIVEEPPKEEVKPPEPEPQPEVTEVKDELEVDQAPRTVRECERHNYITINI